MASEWDEHEQPQSEGLILTMSVWPVHQWKRKGIEEENKDIFVWHLSECNFRYFQPAELTDPSITQPGTHTTMQSKVESSATTWTWEKNPPHVIFNIWAHSVGRKTETSEKSYKKNINSNAVLNKKKKQKRPQNFNVYLLILFFLSYSQFTLISHFIRYNCSTTV